MSENILNLTNGEFDEKGMLRILGTLLTQSGVVQSGAMLVAAQGTPDMTVKVAGAATGHDIVFIASDGALYHGWNTADYNVTIPANASGVTKKDAIVAYADLTAGSGDSNNPGALKFVAVRGSGTNTAPDNTQIQASVVGSNPYVVLAHVTVANGASSINSGNIADQRVRAKIGQVLNDSLVTTGNLVNKAVTTAKVQLTTINSAFTPQGVRFSTTSTTMVDVPGCSMNYTAGETAEILILTLDVTMRNTVAAKNSQSVLNVNGVDLSPNIYMEGTTYTTWSRNYVVQVAAGATVTIKVRAQAAAASTTEVTNDTALLMPKVTGLAVAAP